MPSPVTYIGMLCGEADGNSPAEGTHWEGAAVSPELLRTNI